jgi:hypothetical protein
MISILLTILLVPIAVIILALLLPMKLFFSATGDADAGVVLSGRIMLFNGLAGGGMKFDHGRLWAVLFLGSKQMIGVEVTAAAGRFRMRRKAKAIQKHVKEREREKEEKVTPPEMSFPERFTGWRKQAGKYKEYAAMALRAIRELVRIDYCRARITLGFNDPSLTGKIVGIIFAINSVLPKSFAIQPEWDFSRKIFAGEAALKLTFRNYLFWLHLVKFIRFFRNKSDDEMVVAGHTLKMQEV